MSRKPIMHGEDIKGEYRRKYFKENDHNIITSRYFTITHFSVKLNVVCYTNNNIIISI